MVDNGHIALVLHPTNNNNTMIVHGTNCMSLAAGTCPSRSASHCLSTLCTHTPSSVKDDM